MSILALGRVGWGFFGSTVLVGAACALLSCKQKGEKEDSVSLDQKAGLNSPDINFASDCKTLTPFKSITAKRPVQHLQVLASQAQAFEAFDAIFSIPRLPDAADKDKLIGPMGALGTLTVEAGYTAKNLYFPNNRIEFDRYNIRSIRLFLEWLRDLHPVCSEADYNASEPDQRQTKCQISKDWSKEVDIENKNTDATGYQSKKSEDQTFLGVKWNIYTCETKDAKKVQTVITPLDTLVLKAFPEIEASGIIQ